MCKVCEAEFMDGKNAFCKCPGSWRASAVWDMAAVFALHCSGDASAIR